MSDKEPGFFRKVTDRTRTLPLAAAVTITGALFAWKYVGEYPDWGPGLDFKEHADHPALGVGLSYVGSMASELTYDNPYRSRGAVVTDRAAAGFLLTLVGGAAVEVGVFGPNTFSMVDLAYTLAAGVAGPLCVKSAHSINEAT